ncbi:MAG: ABC transporter permease [Oscillospiraceae bacterium]|jgi:peptide/nickel transport system permease protein|nr:ABC transporter permease [Oscillospiraceae bacterium]
MFKYILKRSLLLIPVLLGVSFAVFLIMRVFSADPSVGEGAAGKYANEEQRQAWRDSHGLNDPIPKQFFLFVKGAVTGDLGKSYKTKLPVLEEILARLPATIELAIASTLISSVLGIIIGVISSIKKNTIIDNLAMIFVSFGISIPMFWFAIMLIIIFSGQLHLFPSGDVIDQSLIVESITGFYSIDTLLTGNFEAFFDFLRHLTLPSIALGLHSMAVVARMTRSSMLDTLNQDYIRTARAKGLSEKKVITNHALRNALIPVITIIGLQLGGLLGGAVLTETVFSWPGIGKYTVESILNSDFPVVQAVVLFVAVIFVITNLVVDVLYVVLDPRIKFTKKGAV